MTAPAVLSPAIVFHPGRLRAARQAAQLNLIQAGALVGRDASVLARYERGEVAPDVAMLCLLAHAYRVDPADLFCPAAPRT
jgi:transcriptional regulator with XRE-family HTH domain